MVTAADLEPYERAEQHSLWLSLLLVGVTVAVATLAAWVAAGRSLRQVQAMADLADEWREHDPSGRFDPGPGGDEIAHLGRTPRPHARPDRRRPRRRAPAHRRDRP